VRSLIDLFDLNENNEDENGRNGNVDSSKTPEETKGKPRRRAI